MAQLGTLPLDRTAAYAPLSSLGQSFCQQLHSLPRDRLCKAPLLGVMAFKHYLLLLLDVCGCKQAPDTGPESDFCRRPMRLTDRLAFSLNVEAWLLLPAADWA